MITVYVTGPSGSGKSAVAQIISMVCQELGLDASTDLEIDLRSQQAMQQVINALKERDTKIKIREVDDE